MDREYIAGLKFFLGAILCIVGVTMLPKLSSVLVICGGVVICKEFAKKL